MIYKFKIDNDCLMEKRYDDAFSGNKNVYLCEFDITCDENDAVWFSVFKKGEEIYIVPIREGKCSIPYEVLETSGIVYIGCYAECAGEKRISTNWIPFVVKEGAYSEGAAPQAPEEELWEVLLRNSVPVIGENGNWFTYDMAEESYIDTGFCSKGDKGQKGDKGDKGDTGDAGHTPQKGVDYLTQAEINEITEEAVSLLCPQNETTSAVITDAMEHNAIDYTIYGASYRVGTPTPANPILIQGVGDLVANVSDENYGKYKIQYGINNSLSTLYISSPIYNVGTYRDYINYKEHNIVFNVAKIKIKDLNWTYQGNNRRFIGNFTQAYAAESMKALGDGWSSDIICECYKTELATNKCICAYSSSIFIWDSDYTAAGGYATDAERIQAWLSNVGENYIYYVLAIPKTYDLELEALTVSNEGNTVTVNTEIEPTISIRYYQDINKVIANLQALVSNQ